MKNRFTWYDLSAQRPTELREHSANSAAAKTSKNKVTLTQLAAACRHVDELIDLGMTENLAIRSLELFADVYCKLSHGGSATPHHVNQVKLWSLAARRLKAKMPDLRPGDHLRVEHGTPRRAFARKILALHREGTLTDATMAELAQRYWKLAVITVEEDTRLNRIARVTEYDTPELRWAAADISFDEAPAT